MDAPGTTDTGNAPHLLALNSAEGEIQFLIARLEPGATGPYTAATGTEDPNAAWKILCAQSWHAPSQGAELLAPALENAFARLKLRPCAITRIAAVRGPGGFTGVRLALATAAGLARAVRAGQAGMDYPALLAASASCRLAAPTGHTAPLWAVTYARKNLVYLQTFSPGPLPRPASAIMVLTPAECASALCETAGSSPDQTAPLLFGSGLSRNREVFLTALAGLPGTDPCPVLLPGDFDHPLPEAMLTFASALSYGKNDITPLYVRPSDAEDNLESIAATLRLDPKAARDRLLALTSSFPQN